MKSTPFFSIYKSKDRRNNWQYPKRSSVEKIISCILIRVNVYEYPPHSHTNENGYYYFPIYINIFFSHDYFTKLIATLLFNTIGIRTWRFIKYFEHIFLC